MCVAEDPDEERAIGDIPRKSVSVQTKLDPPRPSDEGRVFEAEGIDSFSFFEVFEVFEVFEKLRGSAAFLDTRTHQEPLRVIARERSSIIDHVVIDY